MKKILIVLFIIATCVLATVGCDNDQDGQPTDTSTETETETETEATTETETSSSISSISAKCVVKKGNRYVIVLPTSGKSIPVDKACVKYLSLVTDELVLAAETKITEEIRSIDNNPNWQIVPHGNDKVCLVVEVVRFFEGADYMEDAGCGIDHEHLVFAQSIIEEQ